MSNTNETISDVLKALNKKRGSLKSKLTLFDKYVASIESLQTEGVTRLKIVELEQRFNNAEHLIHTFDDIQSEIEYTADDPEEHYAEREDFENRFHSIVARSKILLENFKINDANDADSTSSSKNSAARSISFEGVKLPEIRLPKFDGNYELWMEFRDTFESLIHSNPHINNIQKYHYLRASLTGSAPQVIHSIDFAADNYTLAWNTLCDRFNNKQLLIQNHLKAIFNMDLITTASAVKIRNLYETLYKHLSSLKQLEEPVDSWDTLVIYIISGKLDKNTAHEWEKCKANHASVALTDFRDFLKKRANLLETIEMNFESTKEKRSFERDDTRKYTKSVRQSRGLLSHTNNHGENSQTMQYSKYSCLYCKGGHGLFCCPDILKLNVKDRLAKVKSLRLCTNCLRRNHLPNECKWAGCKTCGKKHNTILHDYEQIKNSLTALSQRDRDTEAILNEITTSNVVNSLSAVSKSAILSTASVEIRNKSNDTRYITARAILDCGSQSSFITTELCDKLELNKTEINLAISGISKTVSFAKYKCDINVKSINSPYNFNLSCLVLDKITADIPDTYIDFQSLNIPSNINLADPEFYEPGSVELLIGADAFWHLLSAGQIKLGKNAPLLQNSRLGWLVTSVITTLNQSAQCNLSVNHDSNTLVQEQLNRFWEIEEINTKNNWSIEEQECEDHFVNTLTTSSDGRYITSLPFKKSPNLLGDSRETATKRFLSLERKLTLNQTLRKSYTDFLNEYERLGHMTEVRDNNNNDKPEYFLPHHGVFKQSSSSTKLRVVFNASSSTSTGLSLNDLQKTGPTIQNDLLSIIIRFRTRAIVLSSDIKMMYRQVLITPEQRNLQKILWRSHPNESIKTYQLNTVTYGTTAASFLAIRCLFEVASECERNHPLIANIIRNDMYVDDLLTGVDTPDEAKYVLENISKILHKRGFPLTKWKSNDPSVIATANCDSVSDIVEFSDNKQNELKTLGLSWHSRNDFLSYNIRQIENSHIITKRTILSKIATIFDPLGLLSPVIITAKVILQKLWSENLTWDDPLPNHVLNSWLRFSSELHALNNLTIPRNVCCNNSSEITLHGFADASEASYGACVYVVSTNSKGERASHLLCAKSKVAPIKSLTMPRLELCAALVLSQLISKVVESVSIKFINIYCWSDSTIVLGWLSTTPNLLKPFVANRVSIIQRLTDTFIWKHVPTSDNPADIVSRGLSPSKLVDNKMWFNGPNWLLDNPSTWPDTETPISDLPEKRKICLLSSETRINFPFERFSNLTKLKRTVAYVLRFIRNCRCKQELRNSSYLSAEELDEGLLYLVKIAQLELFHDEYIALQ